MDQATKLVKQGIPLFQSGDREQAAQYFHKATKADPKNQAAWIWLAQCVDSDQDKRQCLEQAANINPKSKAGVRAQAELDHLPPEPELPPLAAAPPAYTPPPPVNAPFTPPGSPQYVSQTAQSSLMQRLVGVITLKAPIYREIALDDTATTQAAIVHIVLLSITTILAVGLNVMIDPAASEFPLWALILVIPGVIILGLIGAMIGSAFLALISRLFKGQATIETVYRIVAYTQVFTLLNLIPCIGVLAASILQFTGMVIGLREGARFSTGKAVLTLLLPTIVITVLIIIILVFGFMNMASHSVENVFEQLVTVTVPAR